MLCVCVHITSEGFGLFNLLPKKHKARLCLQYMEGLWRCSGRSQLWWLARAGWAGGDVAPLLCIYVESRAECLSGSYLDFVRGSILSGATLLGSAFPISAGQMQ